MKKIIALTALAVFASTAAFAGNSNGLDFATPEQIVYLSTINTATPDGAAQYAGMVAAIYDHEMAGREAYVRQVAAETPFPIFTLEIHQGDVTVTRDGPLMEIGQCEDMKKTATRDITRAYTEVHPEGWTDANGTVWQLADWTIECVHVVPAAD